MGETTSCEEPEGYVSGAGDCDDASAEVSPLADEVCDGVDNDCDGGEDGDGSTDRTVF